MDATIIQAWHDKLADLLTRAQVAARAGDAATQVAVAQELQDFVINHPPANAAEPETAVFSEMETVALNAHDALLFGGIDSRIAALQTNTATLSALASKFQVQTATNQQTARSIQFEKVQEVLAAATNAMTAIKALQAQFEAQPDAEGQMAALGDQLAKALAALEEFKAAVDAPE